MTNKLSENVIEDFAIKLFERLGVVGEICNYV